MELFFYMSLVVQKYGGTSLATVERIINVAERIVKKYNEGNQLIIVASAMGDTTNQLVKKMNMVSDNPTPREADMLLTTGEQISIALLTMAIQNYGCPAISLTGSQACIKTDDKHNRAVIKDIDNKRIKKELKKGKIAVIAGFQGINSKEDFTTLGRGGSDTTTIALMASLKADRCEIYSDVDGIYTTDPRILPNAKKLNFISYDEMLELSSLGAEVLHPHAVELAKLYNLKLYIASSFNNNIGTIVRGVKKMEKKRNVTGVACDSDVIKITIKKVPDKPGIAGNIFTRLAEHRINIDMIIQNLQYNNLNDISFTIHNSDFKKVKEIIYNIAKNVDSRGVEIDQDVAKVSIVGAGMISTPGIAAEMFQAMGKVDVNIQMITKSEIKISCLIKEDGAKKAVESIHNQFNLGEL